jgi:WD40 repeat protein
LPVAAPKLFAHPDQVICAMLSPNGAKLLTGCSDKQVRLWDLAGNKVEHTLSGPTLAISAVAISGDGASLCGGSLDKSITVWNAADGKEVKKFPNLAAAVQSVGFSPDGKALVAGLADGSVKFFDIATGKETRSIPAHQGPVNAVAYLPKGDQVVSAGDDKTVQVWNVADGTNKAKLDQGSPVRALRLSKDGTKAAAGGEDKNVKLWTLGDSKSTSFAVLSEIRGLSFSDDGSKLLVSGGDNRATIYSLDGKQLESFAHDGPVTAAAFHPDNKQIVTTSADKTARLWPISLVWHAAHAGPVRRVLFSPKGDQVFSGSDDKTVKSWGAGDGKPIKSLTAHEGAVTGLSISADGTKLLSAGADKTAKVWNLALPAGGKEEDKPLATVPLVGPASYATLSPSGTRFAIGATAAKEPCIQIFDWASDKELASLSDQIGVVRSIAFLPDNRTVVSASDDKNVRLADVGVQALLAGHTGAVTSVVYHGGANQIFTGGADKTVRLWEIASNKVIKTFGPLPDPVSALGISRDNSSIAASGGKTVKIWSAADGKETASLTGPSDVLSISFNGDKTRLVTGCADNQTRVWDIGSAKEQVTFFQSTPAKSVAFHPNNSSILVAADKNALVESISLTRVIRASDTPIYGLTPTSDGSYLLTCGADKTAKLWNLGNGNAERTFVGAQGTLKAVAISKNNALVATGGGEGIIRVYNFADAKLLGSYKTPGPIESLVFSANNQALIAGCSDKSVVALNVNWNPGQPLPPEFGKVMESHTHAAGCSGVANSADGQTIYSSGLDKAVKAWKFASANPTKSFGHPNLVDVVVYSQDGARLATGCHDGAVRIWDIAKSQVIKEIKAHQITMPNPQPAAVYSLAWSYDGKQLVSGGYDGSLKIWDAANGTLVREFKAYKEKEFEKGHREGVFAVLFSPDNKFLASCSSDHCIKLWNVADGSVAREFIDPSIKTNDGSAPAHPGWVYGLRFTQDSKYLLSIGNAPPNKGHLAIWSVADGKLLFAEDQTVGTYYALTLSPDGKMVGIATGGTGRSSQDNNAAYILKIPEVVK